MKPLKLFIPGPVEVVPEVLQACAVPMVGHRMKEYSEIHGRAKKGMRKLLGTDKGRVFFVTSSSTGAMEGALRNFCGKRALSCSCGNFSERWHAIAKENGKAADLYDVEWGKPNLPEEIDTRLATGKYDCITVVSNETSTGVMNPLAEIAGVMKKYPDVTFCVDAVSSLAGIPLNPETLGIDYLLAGTQKAFGLPPGLAVTYVSDRAMEKAKTVPDRGHYFDVWQFEKRDGKDQTPETPVISLVHALGVQLDRFFAEGLDARFARHEAMAKRCREWANDRFAMFPEKGYESVTLSCIRNTRDEDTVAKIAKGLREKGAVIDQGYGKLKGKTFRIAHMADRRPEDLELLLGWIDEIIK